MANARIVAAMLALLFLSQLCFPACPAATRKIYLAAVTGEETGGVFQLVVETRPGNGTIYSAITPKTGIATQESEEAAVKYAFSSTGLDSRECDVLFKMLGNFGANSVDGPSAGGAMAAATRAALLNKSIRQDGVMTGTILPDGRVGEVGGVIEKSLGASMADAKYFLVPSLKVHEAIMASSLGLEHEFRVIEARNLSFAEEILFSDHSKDFSPAFDPQSEPIPENLTQIKMDADLGRFALVAKEVVDSLDSEVRGSSAQMQRTAEGGRLYGYFSKEIGKYYSLLSLGYPFTSANAAFLLSIDAHYASIGPEGADIEDKAGEVSGCIGGIGPVGKTAENLHWAIGGDLRGLWAKNKLNQTLENRDLQGGYATLRDLFFAQSWCGISKSLYAQAEDIGGKGADETALAALSEERLLAAREAFEGAEKVDYDALWHLENGLAANGSGQYGAAIYEATYAKTMQGIAGGKVENITLAAEKLATGGRKSLWGKIYYGQGAYLLADAKGRGTTPLDAYRILLYSQELDDVALEIDSALAGQSGQAEAAIAPLPQNAGRQEIGPLGMASSALLAFSVFAFGFAIIYRLAKGWGNARISKERIIVK